MFKHDIPRMTYLKAVHMGQKGSVATFNYYDYRKDISGVVFAKTRAQAKRKIREMHGKEVQFWR